MSVCGRVLFFPTLLLFWCHRRRTVYANWRHEAITDIPFKRYPWANFPKLMFFWSFSFMTNWILNFFLLEFCTEFYITRVIASERCHNFQHFCAYFMLLMAKFYIFFIDLIINVYDIGQNQIKINLPMFGIFFLSGIKFEIDTVGKNRLFFESMTK